MRKLILTIGLIFVVLLAFSQDRTVTKMLDKGATYYKYTGVAADTLGPVDQDTIDVVFQVRVDEFISKIELKSRFDLVDGNDTTVAITVSGKNFSDDDYTELISSTLTDDIDADNTVKVLTGSHTSSIASFIAAYEVADGDSTLTYPVITVTPEDYSYRFIKARYIIQGTSAAGSGVKIDEIELKIIL